MKILTCNASIESAMRLRDKIVALTGEHFWVTKDSSTITKGPFVRYGSSAEVGIRDTQFNSARFIDLCVDKRAFCDLLRKNGFYTPEFHFNGEPNRFPVLIRHTLYGCDAQGIVTCRNINEFRNNWRYGSCWTPFVKTEFEVRAHVLGGKLVKIFKKERVKPEKDLPIRNVGHGYAFCLKDEKHYPKLVNAVNRLGKILDGRMYSLDVGWDKENGRYFFFEANSGSSLNDKSAEMYAQYIVKEMKL